MGLDDEEEEEEEEEGWGVYDDEPVKGSGLEVKEEDDEGVKVDEENGV